VRVRDIDNMGFRMQTCIGSLPDIDKVDGSVHDPIRQPLRIILASTNRAPRRLFAFFIILVLIISFGWYLCYNCG